MSLEPPDDIKDWERKEGCTASEGEFNECNPRGCSACCYWSGNRIELQDFKTGGK